MERAASGSRGILDTAPGGIDYHQSTVERSSRLISIFKRVCACAVRVPKRKEASVANLFGGSDPATGFWSIRLYGCCRKSLTNCLTAGRVRSRTLDPLRFSKQERLTHASQIWNGTQHARPDNRWLGARNTGTGRRKGRGDDLRYGQRLWLCLGLITRFALHVRTGGRCAGTLCGHDLEIRGRHRIRAKCGDRLDGRRPNSRPAARVADWHLWRCNRKRYDWGRGRRQCAGWWLQRYDLAAASQHRRRHRSQCFGWLRIDEPDLSAQLAPQERVASAEVTGGSCAPVRPLGRSTQMDNRPEPENPGL